MQVILTSPKGSFFCTFQCVVIIGVVVKRLGGFQAGKCLQTFNFFVITTNWFDLLKTLFCFFIFSKITFFNDALKSRFTVSSSFRATVQLQAIPTQNSPTILWTSQNLWDSSSNSETVSGRERWRLPHRIFSNLTLSTSN